MASTNIEEDNISDNESIIDDIDDNSSENSQSIGEQEEEEEEDLNELDDEEENELDDTLNDKSDVLINNNFVNTIPDISDLDSEEFLQKFDNEVKNNYIINSHPECLNKNFNEIKQLAIVQKNNGFISDKLHRTIPLLTKFERTKILGIRVKQLNSGAQPFISVSEDILDNFIIAEKELQEKKLPFIIQRPLPNNTFEYWYVKDLELY